MRLAFVSLLILVFVLAPIYLLPHIIKTSSGDHLVTLAAREIVAQIPALSGVDSVAVASLEHDYHKALQFALVQELKHANRVKVIDSGLFAKEKMSAETLIDRIRAERIEPEKSNRSKIEADAILTGRIHRNEISDGDHLLHFEAVLVNSSSGEVLWTNSWQASTRTSRAERQFSKSALLIGLAFGAGIFVIFARREDLGRPICAD